MCCDAIMPKRSTQSRRGVIECYKHPFSCDGAQWLFCLGVNFWCFQQIYYHIVALQARYFRNGGRQQRHIGDEDDDDDDNNNDDNNEKIT